MPIPREITTVFFDFGDTLVENNPTYLRRITQLLGEFGFEREYPEVVEAFTRADYLLYLNMREGSLRNDEEFLMQFLEHFGEALAIEIDWPALLPRIYERFGQGTYERVLSEGAVETLEKLRERGCRLGIISNNDGKCREKCEEVGIDHHFEIIIDSALEGVRKPAPGIFEIALDKMCVSPQEAVHVGDMYGSDVLGARDVGISPVWYNNRGLQAFDDYRPDFEVERLDRIPDII